MSTVLSPILHPASGNWFLGKIEDHVCKTLSKEEVELHIKEFNALKLQLTAEREARKTAEQSLDEITRDWQTEIVALRQAEKRAEQEKQSRLKYQGIVYAVANQLDRHLGNKPGSGLLVVEIPAAVETVLAKFQDTDVLGRFKNLLAESVALAEKGNTIDDLKKRAEAAEKACAEMRDAWDKYDSNSSTFADADRCRKAHKDCTAGQDYIPKSAMDEARK